MSDDRSFHELCKPPSATGLTALQRKSISGREMSEAEARAAVRKTGRTAKVAKKWKRNG